MLFFLVIPHTLSNQQRACDSQQVPTPSIFFLVHIDVFSHVVGYLLLPLWFWLGYMF